MKDCDASDGRKTPEETPVSAKERRALSAFRSSVRRTARDYVDQASRPGVQRKKRPADPEKRLSLLTIARSYRFTGVCSHCGKESVGATLRDLLEAASNQTENSVKNSVLGRPEAMAAQHFVTLHLLATRDIAGEEGFARIVQRMRELSGT